MFFQALGLLDAFGVTIAQSKTVDGDSGLAGANYYVKVASAVLGLRLLEPFGQG